MTNLKWKIKKEGKEEKLYRLVKLCLFILLMKQLVAERARKQIRVRRIS